MRRLRTVILLTLPLALTLVTAQAVGVVPVKNTKLFEIQPEATRYNGQYLFAWTRTATPNSTGRGWNVIVSLGGPGRQISSKGAYAWPGGFDDVGRLIFQQALRRSPFDSNLYMWSNGNVSRLPSTVNNDKWQYEGDRWGDWLVYGENQFRTPRSPWSIFVYNFATGRRRLVANRPYSCHCISPGNVVGSLTAWRSGARIYVVQLGPPDTQAGKTAPPHGYFDADPFVVEPTPAQPDSGDETLFWVRSKQGPCGVTQRILKAPLDDLSAATTVASFASGKVNSLSVDDASGGVDVYFGHETCAKTPRGDIFEIANA